MAVFGKLSAKKTSQKNQQILRIYIYIHENAQILQLHNFNLDASWSTECRLIQRVIFTSFLLDVATLRRDNVVTLLGLDINEGKFKATPILTEISEFIISERKSLFCGVDAGDIHLRLYRLPVVTE